MKAGISIACRLCNVQAYLLITFDFDIKLHAVRLSFYLHLFDGAPFEREEMIESKCKGLEDRG